MSRTQQKLQAMSAQELLIQEKKRKIEEKMRLDSAKKSHTDSKWNEWIISYHSMSIFLLANNQPVPTNKYVHPGFISLIDICIVRMLHSSATMSLKMMVHFFNNFKSLKDH